MSKSAIGGLFKTTITERTLNLLFSAQRRLAHSQSSSLPGSSRLSCFLSINTPPYTTFIQSSSGATTTINHSNHSRLLSSSTTTSPTIDVGRRKTCQDCDALLPSLSSSLSSNNLSLYKNLDKISIVEEEEAGDDADDDEEYACVICRRVVCATCAVVSADRRCLECIYLPS